MSSTLDSLHRAVIANPTDRTVRLVYADALEETGDPVHAARAEFIRGQIELESLPEDDARRAALRERCGELFEANWLSWWRPIAAAARLPEPHVPGTRLRQRVIRAVRRRPRRPENWPYLPSTAETEVHLFEYGLAFRLAGGFPEEVRFHNFDMPEGGPVLIHRWGNAIPLVRLSFTSSVGVPDWDRIHGPHLDRLTHLTFARLLLDVAAEVATSQHLAALTHLSANPIGSDPGAIGALVASPPWAGLRTLHLTGRTSPDGVRALAHSCTLSDLEELELTLGNPGLLGGPIGAAAEVLLRVFVRAMAFPSTGAPRWPEFGLALEALAAAPWVRRLRVLRIGPTQADGRIGLFGEPPVPANDVIPDAAVLALADAVTTDKLERLELPAALIAPSVREEIADRLGERVAFM